MTQFIYSYLDAAKRIHTEPYLTKCNENNLNNNKTEKMMVKVEHFRLAALIYWTLTLKVQLRPPEKVYQR